MSGAGEWSMADGAAPDAPRWESACKVADDELKSSGGAIRAVACTSELVVTSSSRPVVKVWQIAEASVKQTARLSLVELHGAVGSSCVEVTGEGDGQLAAVCYDDGGIGLWDLRSSVRVMELMATIPTAWKAKFLPGGRRLVSGGPSGSLCFWDLRAGGRLEAEVGTHASRAKGEDDLEVKRRRTEAKVQPGTGGNTEDGDKYKSPIFSLAVSPNGALLGCGRGSGIISVMRLETQEWAGDVHAHSGDRGACVRALTFDAQSRLILSGGDDSHVALFDAETWVRRRNHGVRRCSQLERFSTHKGWITSVSTCPDPTRRVLVTTSWDATVKLWDYSTHALLHTYKDHSDSVFDSAFEPHGGRFFVSVGVDACLALYVAKHSTPAAKEDENALALVPVKVKEGGSA